MGLGSVRALGYVGIAARDLAAWETFALDVLGLQLHGRDDDGTLHLRMDEHAHRVVVHPGDADDIAYAGWEVADEAQLVAFEERLRDAGIPSTRGSAAEIASRRVGGLLKAEDPSGLRVELFWGARIDYAHPFRSARPIAGFETQDKGLGHVVLVVRDFARTMAFYRELLGMRVSDFIEFERLGTMVTMAFMHCNARHHSLAFMELPTAPKRLSHIMLEVRSLDDVGRTFTLCEERGLPIAMTLGRHTNDHMFSFYVVSPSGFAVEYGWGGRTVDDAIWRVQTHQSASMWGHRRLLAPATPSRS